MILLFGETFDFKPNSGDRAHDVISPVSATALRGPWAVFTIS
jgi:hypothetical protein